MAVEAKNQPNATGLAHNRQRADVKLVRDVYAGTRCMRENAALYLPKFPMETVEGYASRVKTAVLFNALKRTVVGLTGMIFRKPPALKDDVPEQIVEHAENIDLNGRALHVFMRDVTEAAILDGHSHIFVDYQAVPPGAIQTLADEREAGLRPYWVHLLKMQVLRFRTLNVNGEPLLVDFAYGESVTEPDGEYGEKAVERVRRYQLVANTEGGRKAKLGVVCTIWKKVISQTGESWVIDGAPVNMAISRIPLATLYTDRVAFMESVPLLLDLAFENVRHFQLRSDRDNTLHICGVPVPIFMGLQDDKKIAVGSDTGVILPIGGDAKYLEAEGKALTATREELKDIESRMAALGLQMLQRETRAAETAESKEIDKSESDSRLAAIAGNTGDTGEQALSFHAEWLDLGADAGGSLEVNKDFREFELSPAQVKEMREMVASGDLSIDTLWDQMVAGSWLPESFDPEKEKDRIAQRLTTMPTESQPTADSAKEPAAA